MAFCASPKNAADALNFAATSFLSVSKSVFSSSTPPVDAARDDSTALAALPQETLARLLLPLGEFDTGDLAELAQELQL